MLGDVKCREVLHLRFGDEISGTGGRIASPTTMPVMCLVNSP